MFTHLFRGKPKSFDLTPEQDSFLGAATREYNEKSEILRREWGFSDYERWDFDQFSRVLRLQVKDGSRVEADAQAIGSYSEKGNSWEWAWNNPNIEEPLKIDVRLVRDFGKKEKIEYLVAPIVPVPHEKVPTYLSAVAIKVIGSDGVFAGAAGEITVYLSLKGLRRKRG